MVLAGEVGEAEEDLVDAVALDLDPVLALVLVVRGQDADLDLDLDVVELAGVAALVGW